MQSHETNKKGKLARNLRNVTERIPTVVIIT